MQDLRRDDRNVPGPAFDVRVHADVVYGQAGISFGSTQARNRDLLMDIYEPIARDTNPRPAVVLAFGGAFHRGAKEDDSFEDGRNTPIAEYCRVLACSGYVCASVGYRLIPEVPDPGLTPVLTAPDEISRSRMDHVREVLGLGPATGAMISNGIEAAADDVTAAAVYMRDYAGRYGADPRRIVLGGFSAGGTAALYAVFGHRFPAAGLIVLSGRMEAADISAYLGAAGPNGAAAPPILQFVGEADLDYVRKLTAMMRQTTTLNEHRHVVCEVANAGHFYPRSAEVARPDGSLSTVEGEIHAFISGL